MTTYERLNQKLNGRTQRKLKNNTYAVRLNNSSIGVKLHNTYVVTAHADGRVVLNSGGYQTVTTKDRINGYGPIQVYQRQHVWYFFDAGIEHEFESGMVYDEINHKVHLEMSK